MRAFLTTVFFLITITFSFGQNQNVSNGNVFDGEPYLSINPNNSQHIVVAWIDWSISNFWGIKTCMSTDGGQNWSPKVNIPHAVVGNISADPALAFDNNGNVYLCYIDYTISPITGAVYVIKSTDGGITWNTATEVINVNDDGTQYPVDRPWISIDNSGGVNDGNIYVTTMNPTVFGSVSPPYNPYFIRSTDGGVSFDPWKYIDTTNWLAGSIIPQPTPFQTISSNGTFHCVYPSWVLSQNLNPQFIFASSSDAGNSFSYSSIIAPYSNVFNDSLPKKGFPLVANPADANHLVFLNLIIPHGDADVFMWESFDGGITWSDSVRVNDDPIGNNRMQDLIWADFDNDGDLVVSWRDRRNGTDSTYITASEIWGAVRRKDSTNFSPNFRISDTLVAYDTILAFAGNDFMCIKFVNDTLNAVWGDTRDGKLNIWFQRISIDGIILSTQQISSNNYPNIKIYPNPSVSNITIEGKNLNKVIIISENGKIISTKENLNGIENLVINLTNLSNGIYFVQVTASDGIITKKIIKQ
jgi:hypothetical protein